MKKACHIIELKAENFKRLKAVTIKPNESGATILNGNNGEGKTSVLDAILAALAGKSSIDQVPVRVGEDGATIEVLIDSEPHLLVRRTIKPDGKTVLKVTQVMTVGGEKIESVVSSPQKILDTLIGSVAFDPLEFTRKRPQEQVTILAKIAGVDPTGIDAEIQKLEEARKSARKELDSAQARVQSMPRHEDAPAEEINSGDLLEELKQANQSNQQNAHKWQLRYAAVEKRDNLAKQIEDLQKQLAEVEAALKLPEPSDQTIDIKAIEERISQVSQVNRKVAENKARATAAQVAESKEAEWTKIDTALEAKRSERIAMMEQAKWPVPGLGFAEHGVTFNGLPFEQCSSAESLRIGASIAMSLSPALKIMFIRDGSLLDGKSLAMIHEMAQEEGCQVFIERVGKGDPGAIIIEDGEVAGINE